MIIHAINNNFRMVLFGLIVFSATGAKAEDKVLGLLELPALCAAPCPGSETPVPLYEAPYLEEPALEINRALFIKDDPLRQDRDSPYWPVTEDIVDDKAAAVVFGQVRDSAYQIRIGDQSYWVKKQEAGYFHPYPQLLTDRLTFLQDWDFWLWQEPEGKYIFVDHPLMSHPTKGERLPVRVVGMKRHRGHWWIQVEILQDSPCLDITNNFLVKGWLPAYREDGKRSAWFDPQGCP